ncbi:MAG: hypothetical protein D6715_12105 [Calditrichaeota bacterium]|nr:MAG: hypothetical protein D6715_12105 [Calditrichota bacterium]
MIYQAVIRWAHLLCIFGWLFALSNLLTSLSAQDSGSASQTGRFQMDLGRRFLWLWESSGLVLVTGLLALLLHTRQEARIFSQPFLLFLGLKLAFLGLLAMFQAYATRLYWQLTRKPDQSPGKRARAAWLLKTMLWLAVSLAVPVSLLGVILRYY